MYKGIRKMKRENLQDSKTRCQNLSMSKRLDVVGQPYFSMLETNHLQEVGHGGGRRVGT
jgi:hypothetical protein